MDENSSGFCWSSGRGASSRGKDYLKIVGAGSKPALTGAILRKSIKETVLPNIIRNVLPHSLKTRGNNDRPGKNRSPERKDPKHCNSYFIRKIVILLPY
jgi:hypothetical protein